MKIRLKIDNVDLTSSLFEDWVIHNSGGATIDVLEIRLNDPSNSISIGYGKDIIIEKFSDSAIRNFGGIVTEAVLEPIGLGRIWSITAQDWKTILDKSTFTNEYRDKTDKYIIQDAFTEAGVTEFDVSTYVAESREIPFIRFVGTTLRQMLETLKSFTNLQWDISPFKELLYRTVGTVSAPFNFSDNPDMVTTFPYQNPLLTRELGEFNSVEVRGGDILSLNFTNIYSGDGARTLYKLYEQDNPVIEKAPSTATDDLIDIDRNTGTDGVPIWTAQTITVDPDASGYDVLWRPLQAEVLFAVAPPNFATNSWRSTGRRFIQAVAIQRDEEAFEAHGREYKKVIVEPDVDDVQLLIEVAQAFLRDARDRYRFALDFDKDGIEVGQQVILTCQTLGEFAVKHLVISMDTRLQGAEVAKYSAVFNMDRAPYGPLPTLASLFSELKVKAGAKDVDAIGTLLIIKKFTEALELTNIEVRTASRGPLYYSQHTDTRTNLITNPSFVEDLTGWTELIDGGITATTIRDTLSKYREGSLAVDLTASTNAGYAGRYLDIAASPDDALSVSEQLRFEALSNATAGLMIRWLNAALATISEESVFLSAINSDFELLSLENKIAPATTAWARIYIWVRALGAGGTGTAYFDGILTEKASAIGAYFDGFENDGFWQGTPNDSISVKGDNEIICGFWKTGLPIGFHAATAAVTVVRKDGI